MAAIITKRNDPKSFSYVTYARSLRQNIGKTGELNDMDTNDLFVEISRAIDKRLWFLEAHLQTSFA